MLVLGAEHIQCLDALDVKCGDVFLVARSLHSRLRGELLRPLRTFLYREERGRALISFLHARARAQQAQLRLINRLNEQRRLPARITWNALVFLHGLLQLDGFLKQFLVGQAKLPLDVPELLRALGCASEVVSIFVDLSCLVEFLLRPLEDLRLGLVLREYPMPLKEEFPLGERALGYAQILGLGPFGKLFFCDFEALECVFGFFFFLEQKHEALQLGEVGQTERVREFELVD